MATLYRDRRPTRRRIPLALTPGLTPVVLVLGIAYGRVTRRPSPCSSGLGRGESVPDTAKAYGSHEPYASFAVRQASSEADGWPLPRGALFTGAQMLAAYLEAVGPDNRRAGARHTRLPLRARPVPSVAPLVDPQVIAVGPDPVFDSHIT